jgi:hypothetical protein
LGSHFSVGRRLRVTVANGDHVTSGGLLRQAAITKILSSTSMPFPWVDLMLFSGPACSRHSGQYFGTSRVCGCPFGVLTITLSGMASQHLRNPATSTFAQGKTYSQAHSLLASYTDVFTKPRGLPPPRAHDHRIRLVPHQWPSDHIVTQPSRKTSLSDNVLTCWSVALYAAALLSFPHLFSW